MRGFTTHHLQTEKRQNHNPRNTRSEVRRHKLALKTPSSIQFVSTYFYLVPTTTPLDPLTIRRIKTQAAGLHSNITSGYFTLSQATRSNIQRQISMHFSFIKPTERVTQTIHAAHTNLIHDELNELTRDFEQVRTRENTCTCRQ